MVVCLLDISSGEKCFCVVIAGSDHRLQSRALIRKQNQRMQICIGISYLLGPSLAHNNCFARWSPDRPPGPPTPAISTNLTMVTPQLSRWLPRQHSKTPPHAHMAVDNDARLSARMHHHYEAADEGCRRAEVVPVQIFSSDANLVKNTELPEESRPSKIRERRDDGRWSEGDLGTTHGVRRFEATQPTALNSLFCCLFRV